MRNNRRKKQTFAEVIQERFGWDVTDLDDYIDETSEEIHRDLVFSAGLKKRISIMENVKGSKKIKLLRSDLVLQSADTCGRTPNGTIIFSDKTLVTERVKIDASLCNEDLVDTWAQMLLAVGARNQDEEMPIESVIAAYTVEIAHNKDQRLIFLGDTTSLDPDLQHYDGLIKKWEADVLIPSVNVAAAAVTDANGFAVGKAMTNSVPAILKDKKVPVEIIGSRNDLQAILDNVWNDKDYNALVNFTDVDGELSFRLPTTNETFRSYPEIPDGNMYVVPYMFVFYGTDLESDVDGFSIYYDEKDEVLYFGMKWRSGIQYVYPEYFRKLNLTLAS